LKREYELELLTSAPSVVYKFRNLQGEYFMESNPSKIPNDARHFEEPFVKLDIVCPDQYNGAILELCQVLPNSYFSLF
jgi:GTP-binding protein LepA